MKRITYTKHVKDRMAERGVTEAQVQAIINDPELVLPGTGQTVKYIGTVDGRRLKVFCDPANPTIVVITTAWEDP